MPIYEYQCGACGHQLEALQRMSDSPLTDCPACEAAALKKKISAVGFRLKGSGWYETDFKTGGKKNLAGDAAQPAGADQKPAAAEKKAAADKKPVADTAKAS
jgi:putative FmdB family regulatory protein